LRVWLKNRVFFGWSKFVNAYVKRGKKNFGFWDFWFQVYAHLIEKSPLAAGALGWSFSY